MEWVIIYEFCELLSDLGFNMDLLLYFFFGFRLNEVDYIMRYFILVFDEFYR